MSARWRERDGGRDTVLVRIEEQGRALSAAEVLARLAGVPEFRAFFGASLAGARFGAFFFECAPLTRARLDAELEIALVDAPTLARTDADPHGFEEQFTRAPHEDVRVFANLGGDAELIVPAPRAAPEIYAHLASFVRGAPAAQIDALLRTIGERVARVVSAAPLWVSTAGLGVPWLHVRLDQRPKYYRHAPFRRAP